MVRQRGVLAERCGDHHHVHRARCGQGLAQIGVQVHPIVDRQVQHNSRVDGRNQLDQALIHQASDPLGVDLSEPRKLPTRIRACWRS